jgi:hypothetical protein
MPFGIQTKWLDLAYFRTSCFNSRIHNHVLHQIKPFKQIAFTRTIDAQQTNDLRTLTGRLPLSNSASVIK